MQEKRFFTGTSMVRMLPQPSRCSRSTLSAGGSTSPGLGLLQVYGMNIVGDSCTDTGDELPSATAATVLYFV